MRLAASSLGAALLLVATPASAENTALSPPQKVTSKDGSLAVSVPRGALKKPAKVRIRVLTRAQYPPELRNATFRPGSKLYALEPAGLKFLKPVTITRRIDTKVAGFDPEGGLPVIVLTTQSTAGSWDVLARQTVRANGRTLVVAGTTRHFSTVLAYDSGARIVLSPDSIFREVGDTFDVTLRVDIDNRLRKDPISVENTTWEGINAVGLQTSRGQNGATFVCTKIGTGIFLARVKIEEFHLASALLTFGRENSVFGLTVTVSGDAGCRRKAVELAFACVVVAHSPLGSFPSFTRWLLQFATANLPANAQAALIASGVNNGQAISQPVNASTGKAELVGGISSFGQKPVQSLTVGGQDVTPQLVSKVGTPNVTAAQGTIAGQCPP